MKRMSVTIDERQCAELERKSESGEIESISEGVRDALEDASYGTSDFRCRCDRWGTGFGMLGLLLLGLTAPMPFRIRTLVIVPFGISFVFYGIGYLNDVVLPEINHV